MAFRSRVASQLRIAAAIVLLPLLFLPGVVTASSQHRAPASASLKSLALQLSDVQHIYGRLALGGTGSNHKSNDIACTNASEIQFANSFGASKNNLSIAAMITQYTSSAGPRCHLKYDLSVIKTLGPTMGVVSPLSGVGDQAVLIRLDPTKGVSGPPNYGLSAKFIRGRYFVLVLVQMNRKVQPTDVTKLAKAVDSRIKHGG